MNFSKLKSGALALATALVILLTPSSLFAAESSIRKALEQQQIHVSSLEVIQAEGIVIVRGQVSQAELAARIPAIVKNLGYARVANLVEVVAVPDDEGIVLNAERELALTRSLEGSRLVVSSNNGIVTVRGTVQTELQKDLAAQVIRRVSGVKDVLANLNTV